MRQRPRGLGDDGRIPGIGLRLTRVEVGDAPHREPRQIPDEDSFGLRDGDRQGTDRGGLVDDNQHGAMLFQLLQHRPHLRLVVGQGFIEHDSARLGDSDGVVLALTDVDTDEHVDAVVVLDHDWLRPLRFQRPGPRRQVPASTLRTTSATTHSRAPISDHPTPTRPGDNTPRIINDWGQQSCRT